MSRNKTFQLDIDGSSKKLNFYCFDGKIDDSTGLVEVNMNECFPSYRLIKRIAEDLCSSKDAFLFVDISNIYIARSRYKFFPEEYNLCEIENPKERKRGELEKEMFINMRNQFNAAGLDEKHFRSYWKSFAIITWFQYMLSNVRSHNYQGLERTLSPILKALKAERDIDSPIKYKIQRLGDDSILEKYPEYLSALAIVKANHKYLNHAEKSSHILKELKIDGLKLFIKLVKEFGNDLGKYQVFICPICRKCQEILAGKKELVHCGSKQCKREYFRIWEQAHHPKKGWVFDPLLTKPWQCLGGCGSNRRKLNSDRICFKCYPKTQY